MRKVIFVTIMMALNVIPTLASATSNDFDFKTDSLSYVIGTDGISKTLWEKNTRKEWLSTIDTPFAAIRKRGKVFPVTNLKSDGVLLHAEFGQSGVKADFRITDNSAYIVIQLVHLQGEGVEEVHLLQLRLAHFKNAGGLVVARWNEKFVVSIMGLSDSVNCRLVDKNDLIVATLYPEFGMEGQKVAIIAVPTPQFMTAVLAVEHDFHLPSPMLSGQWAKVSPDVRESYLFTDLTEANVDETIRYAKLAGFKYILIYSNTWSTSNGSYPINKRNFLNGEDSLKAVIDKCHARGLKVGMHMLTSFVGKNDPLVRPRPDPRLLKDAEVELAMDLGVQDREIIATKELVGFPSKQAFYGSSKSGLDIQIDDEIIQYHSIGGNGSTRFVECIRGYAGTKAATHKAGTKIYHLAERYGSYLADLRTSLKSEISERVAGLINRCGFDMIIFDGGEVNSANGPWWYWGSQQQMDIWKRVKRDLLVQGSGITPWTWHIFSRGYCDDFASVAPKEYLDFHKITDALSVCRNSFLPVELGWLGFLADAPHHFATTPDEVEYYAIRMLAFDASVSIETNLKALKTNGRTEEILSMLGQYEKLRLQNILPKQVRDRLRTSEWHASWEGNKPKFHLVKYDVKRLNSFDKVHVKNDFGPQEFKFRLQALPQLAEVGDQSNIVLLHPDESIILKHSLSISTPKSQSLILQTDQSKTSIPGKHNTDLPGILAERVEFIKPTGRLNAFKLKSRGNFEKIHGGKPLDLSTHKALAVKLKIDGPLPKPGEPCAVLNIQLESGGKWYRDHYIDLDFTGERTIIIPEPTTERMLPEFRPVAANYAFKAAMCSFNYKNIVTLNFRWMRQPVSKNMQCRVSLVEALTEKESVLKNPMISVGTSKVLIPVALNSGDYVEFWGERQARVFNRTGEQLSTIEITTPSTLQKGSNEITLDYEGQGSAKLTTIILGEALKY